MNRVASHFFVDFYIGQSFELFVLSALSHFTAEEVEAAVQGNVGVKEARTDTGAEGAGRFLPRTKVGFSQLG